MRKQAGQSHHVERYGCSLSFFNVRRGDGREKGERKSGKGKDGEEGERKNIRTWELQRGRWIGIRDKRRKRK